MTHPLYFCKYVRFNLKLLHNLSRNHRITSGQRCNFSESSNSKSVNNNSEQKHEKNDTKTEGHQKKEYPEEPTTCCMSGCANCVWLDYAEKLSEYYKDGGEQAIKEINEKITDENLKAFLLFELRMRNKR